MTFAFINTFVFAFVLLGIPMMLAIGKQMDSHREVVKLNGDIINAYNTRIAKLERKLHDLELMHVSKGVD